MNSRKILVTAMALAFAANVATAYAKPGGDRGPRGGERGGSPEQKAERIMNHLDADDSGTITLDEWLSKTTEKAEKQFNRIDTDDDNLISLEEFLAIGGHRDHDDIDLDAVRQCVADASGEEVDVRPDRETRFDAADTNDDGFIDLDEMIAAKTEGATERFNHIDSNDDGAVTLEELTAALEGRQEIREIRRNCVQEQRDTEDLLAG